MPPASNASNIRYLVALASVLMAFMLYLDRVCLGEIVKSESFRADVAASKQEIGQVLGAFFFTYAIAQIPAGWASDRWGARRMLTMYILGWSLMTAWTGWVQGLIGLLIARLACGLAQAGAYPTSGGVIRRWFPPSQRAAASSWVSFGGRLGGMLAPTISALLILFTGNWRVVLVIYGAIGVLVAIFYWWIVRDAPTEHPGVNALELETIAPTQSQTVILSSSDEERLPIWPVLAFCCTSRSLWLSSLAQFSINVGWAFLITWLPSYLTDVQKVDPLVGAAMVTGVLACGLPGMLIGGWASDYAVSRWGLRRGRIKPLTVATGIAACAYLVCPWLPSVWLIVACCGLVAMMTDLGNPSFWAFMQDIGGRNTATIYGWANMWGNLGATLSSLMVPYLMRWGESGGIGQALVFFVCSGFFFIACIASLGVDASKPLGRESAARFG
ncbi:MAG: MFS transporter [Planctomycetota bacterium]